MKQKQIIHLTNSSDLQVGTANIKQPLPNAKVSQISPFLLLHHLQPISVAAGIDPLGVGPHPHRGFEPITFLFSGGIEHRDSHGNHGILASGDVQWMTAGRGIVHSERASKEFMKAGGTLELVQLWVNLPKKDKMTAARYQDIKSEQIPVITQQQEAIKIRIIAGNFEGKTGPANTFSPITALHVTMKPNSKATLPIAKKHNSFVYVLGGHLNMQKTNIEATQLAVLSEEGDFVSITANKDSHFLLLSGEPIHEKVVSWGPYVMNTQTEILEAMRDYQAGKMGILTY
ncbi:MAG: pirin family protein [Chitinophagales bacterium]